MTIFTYPEYKSAFEYWVVHHESSHAEKDEALINFTKLNWSRSDRIHRTIKIIEPLENLIRSLEKEYHWKIITESWCGDSAQCLPIIGDLAALNPLKIKLSIYLRDSHLEMIDRYLTHGSRSIPKLIVLEGNSEKEIAIWGPRPKPAQEILFRWKKEVPQRTWEFFEHDLHTWYAHDKTQTLQLELLELFQEKLI